jgi:hypothetical protein
MIFLLSEIARKKRDGRSLFALFSSSSIIHRTKELSMAQNLMQASMIVFDEWARSVGLLWNVSKGTAGAGVGARRV